MCEATSGGRVVGVVMRAAQVGAGDAHAIDDALGAWVGRRDDGLPRLVAAARAQHARARGCSMSALRELATATTTLPAFFASWTALRPMLLLAP